jgi:hypothetical protein
MWEKALSNGLSKALSSESNSDNDLNFQSKYSSFISNTILPNENMIARDHIVGSKYPISGVKFLLDSAGCDDACPHRYKLVKTFENYIRLFRTENELRWTPVVIDLEKNKDYSIWERFVKKSYDRVRMKNKSIRTGYIFKQFHLRLFAPDIYEIHNSASVRSGGAIRGTLVKTIEELGGYPTKYLKPILPNCEIHWQMSFGIFKSEPGYKQGDVVVDEKLIAYISINRNGDLCNYSQLIGHDKYLADGIMYHCHFKIIEWLMLEDNLLSKGAKFLMYGGVGNGGAGLWQWKRSVGFVPHHIYEAN